MASKSGSRVDCYGFELAEDFDYETYEQFMEKYLGVLARRAKKWQNLLDGNKTVTRNYKVKRYVRKGIPSEHRGMMWATVSGVCQLRDQYPATYKNCLAAKKDKDIISAINMDLPRTYPDNVFFQKMDEGHLGSLFNVLVAFGHYHKEIGYCQGINYVAGLLLLVVKDEEITFWLLSTLVDKIVINYYTKEMDGLLKDIDVLDQLVRLKLPQISDHIKQIGIGWPLLVSKWFICLFAEVLPIETVFRIWDCLFYEGNKILFRVALTLLKSHQEKILAAPDIPHMVDCFKQITADSSVLNCHKFMESIFKEPGSLSKVHIEKLRAQNSS